MWHLYMLNDQCLTLIAHKNFAMKTNIYANDILKNVNAYGFLPSLFRYDHLCLILVELCPQRVVVEENLCLPGHL